MAGYRFANPNRALAGSIGEALNRAAGSVDNIAIAMMRNRKSPEERALEEAHRATYEAQARKFAADAEGQELANRNVRDPLGAIAQAVIGGDRETARSNMASALQFQDSGQAGPPQYADVLPQVRRDVRSLAVANATDPKSIAKIMQNVLREQQLGDMGQGTITPQEQVQRNYAAGVTTNAPVKIDGKMLLEMGSGKATTTPIADAMIGKEKAQANQANATAGMNSAHAGLYRAETDNEIAGTPGRTGGGRGAAGEKPETATQRMKREAKNAETLRARQRIQDFIASGVPASELRSAKKDSEIGRDILAGNRALEGEDDPDYAAFAKAFDGSEEAKTVAEAIKVAQELSAIPGMAGWGTKYSREQVKAELAKQFPTLTTDSVTKVLEQRLAAPTTKAAAPAAPQVQQQPPTVAQKATGAPVQVKSPAEAKALPPGTVYITPDGRRFTR